MKGNLMLKFAVFLLLAALIGFCLHAFAQPRQEVRSAVTPIGSSSSNGVSFAWFYDPADRTVYLCRAGSGGGDAVDCKPRTTLP
jgi:hypothetical protein